MAPAFAIPPGTIRRFPMADASPSVPLPAAPPRRWPSKVRGWLRRAAIAACFVAGGAPWPRIEVPVALIAAGGLFHLVSKGYLARRVRIEEVETRIAETEQAIKDIEGAMAAPGFYDDRAAAQTTIDRHQALMWEVGDLMHQWEELQSTETLTSSKDV